MDEAGTGLLADLRRERLLAIVRGNDPDAVVRCVLILVEEGIRLVEVSLAGRGAAAAPRAAVAEVGDAARVGAGTVRRGGSTAGVAGTRRVRSRHRRGGCR